MCSAAFVIPWSKQLELMSLPSIFSYKGFVQTEIRKEEHQWYIRV
ncbi:Uncharacterised protein [Mycobacterium tuberculosis]|nr:Uncharacterised protein [Mycobacterium tuberculosis]